MPAHPAILTACLGLGLITGCARNQEQADLAWARGVRPMIWDRAIIQQQRGYRQTFNEQFSLQLNAAEEKKIPYTGVMDYPPDWPRISELCDRPGTEQK